MHVSETLSIDVLEAARRRIAYVFAHFDNVVVAFSGGKDSGVLLNLAIEHVERHEPARRIGVFHLDYEAQYSATTDYVDATYQDLAGRVENLRCCVPVKVPTCTSMYQTFWRPWEEEKRNLWVRDLPPYHLSAADFPFITPEMSDYEFQERFSLWHHQKTGAGRTCILIGLRAEESLDRWRTIVSDRNIHKFQGRPWTTKVYENVYNAYPIYDWAVEDIWRANGRFGWRYNSLYDLFHQAGVPLHAMRVASPFISAAKASLSLYRAIDPQIWGRLVSRVNGVNFMAIYGDTKAVGWREVEKPAHMTWKDYAMFLLDTLPPETAEGFRQKLATSIKFWREKGGVLTNETMDDLRRAGIHFEVGGPTNYKTDKLPVRMEYADDVESNEFRLIPTWKRLAITILKNDHAGKYMGFAPTKAEMARRAEIIEKYRGL
ncbi:DUF3440 domain-containing protein [Niveispirillum fermenti]|uniref:DUF3440 domain-containing protein n=1 Tax=Niveispirillum fermenti TaxID=1233113 RepID=UPI003A8AF4D0